MNPTQEPASSEPVATGPAASGGAHQQSYGADPYDAVSPPHPPDGQVGDPAHYWPVEAVPRRRRSWRGELGAGALTALVVAAAGVPLGLLWSWLSPSVPVGRNAQGEIIINDPSPEQFIAADGWFTLLGVGFGVIAAIAAWLILRRHRGPALLLGVVLGALGAAGVAWQVGRRLGLADYERWQQVATAGDTFGRPPDLHAHGPLLVPAFAAVIVTTLLVGWSNDPDLDVPGARPGYGHDIGSGGPHPDDYPQHPGDPLAGGFSSGSPGAPDPTAAPAPPAPGPAGPPHG